MVLEDYLVTENSLLIAFFIFKSMNVTFEIFFFLTSLLEYNCFTVLC